MKKVILFSLFISILFAQGSISGSVTRADNGDPLLGVNVLVQNTFMGTTTDINGQFVIDQLKSGEYALVISMIGFKQYVEKGIIVSDNIIQLDIKLAQDVLSAPHVVVTASRQAQDVMELPVSMSVIGPRQIRDRAVVNLTEAMKYEPGVSTVRGQIKIRGATGYTVGTGDRTLLMIDGVPLLGSGAGNITWTMIPVSEVAQVEIIRSGGSALYGSSALGGVVNVLTKNAPAKPETRFRLKSGIYSDPKYKQWEWRSKPGLFNYLDVTHSRPIGNHSGWIRVHKAKSDGYKRQGWLDANNITGKFKFNFGERYNASVFANYYSDDVALASQWKNAANPFEAPTGEEDDHTTGAKLHINGFFNMILSDKTVLKFKGSMYDVWWQNHSATNDKRIDEQKGYGELQINTTLGQKTNITAGLVTQKSKIRTSLYGDHTSTSMAVYIQAQQRIGQKLTLNTGARMETYSVDGEKLDESAAPQIALNYRMLDWLSFRSSISRGFRVPAIAEMYTRTKLNIFIVEPNPDLIAERSQAGEVGMTMKITGNKWISDIQLDVAGFKSVFDQLIVANPNDQGIIHFENLTDARISGLEVGASGALINQSILFSMAYTNLNPEEIDKEGNAIDTLAYRFRNTLVTTIGTRIFGVTASIENRYMSQIERVKLFQENPITGQDKRVPIHIWNANIGTNIRGWDLLFRVENMFQYYYTELERNMGDERHFSLTVSKKI
ncbi:MAG: TonB-dependent receptor [Candidatus Marinimicrobia bacterium]|nr:TonB-dependent receptor [Candidatus Neomarinimicrobiota bacterium]MBL7010713.1 TonB-dependent receptor [Candidatus Neomarinimicrobiota bacterium]MBL7029880.1 TonB-dependent receptor [Candidatus Neomarinimicrobiota bacterium]